MNTEAQSIPGGADVSSATRQTLENAKSDIQGRLSDVKEAAQHTYDEVKGAATATAQAAREGYQALRREATEQFESYSEEVRHYVRDNPLKSVGAALLAGVVVGMLARK